MMFIDNVYALDFYVFLLPAKRYHMFKKLPKNEKKPATIFTWASLDVGTNNFTVCVCMCMHWDRKL